MCELYLDALIKYSSLAITARQFDGVNAMLDTYLNYGYAVPSTQKAWAYYLQAKILYHQSPDEKKKIFILINKALQYDASLLSAMKVRRGLLKHFGLQFEATDDQQWLKILESGTHNLQMHFGKFIPLTKSI